MLISDWSSDVCSSDLGASSTRREKRRTVPAARRCRCRPPARERHAWAWRAPRWSRLAPQPVNEILAPEASARRQRLVEAAALLGRGVAGRPVADEGAAGDLPYAVPALVPVDIAAPGHAVGFCRARMGDDIMPPHGVI